VLSPTELRAINLKQVSTQMYAFPHKYPDNHTISAELNTNLDAILKRHSKHLKQLKLLALLTISAMVTSAVPSENQS
jgi:hypothetical protein